MKKRNKEQEAHYQAILKYRNKLKEFGYTNRTFIVNDDLNKLMRVLEYNYKMKHGYYTMLMNAKDE